MEREEKKEEEEGEAERKRNIKENKNWQSHSSSEPHSCLFRPVTCSEMTHALSGWICLDASHMKHKRGEQPLTFIGAYQLKGEVNPTCQTWLMFLCHPCVSLCVCVCAWIAQRASYCVPFYKCELLRKEKTVTHSPLVVSSARAVHSGL